MNEIAERKRLLTIEADLHRALIQAEGLRLRQAITWAGRITDLRRQMAPWAPVLLPLAGVALALGLRRAPRFVKAMAGAVEKIQLLTRIWRALAAPSNEPK